ncbi:MAG: sugar phosphate isomerase/epimerase, partial [Armatimonadetes bacterium]|nr:sugar phosphate isomerase/epimerase [Armatimonadota bacterium]
MKPLSIGVMLGGQDPVMGMEKIGSLGMDNCQMLYPESKWHSDEGIARLKETMAKTGVTVSTIFCGFEGESYADIPTIQRTVGLVNPETRPGRVAVVYQISDFAAKLGVNTLAAHIGFVPEETGGGNYEEVVAAVQGICDKCKSNGQCFSLETGQETGQALYGFIQDVNRDNLRVNFDPANMLLYGSGDPIEALSLVGKYVIGVHCKDGKMPTQEGQLGHEYPLGEGDVGIPRFLAKLKELGYQGPLTIEREITGDQQTKDILKAKELLEGLKQEIFGV